MKTKVHRLFLRFSAAGLLIAQLGPSPQDAYGQSVSAPPTITMEPASLVVGYGSDASFTVVAAGAAPLTYQWRKDGADIADFDNVAGAQTSTLQLVGVAENDAAKYTVAVRNDGGAVTSAVARLSIRPSLQFSDDFQDGSTNWHELLDSLPMTVAKLGTNQGGGLALLATNARQKVYHNLSAEYDSRLCFTFWMYDDGSPLSACGQLRGYTGPGYGKYVSPGGLWQGLVLGKYNGPFYTNLTAGSLRGLRLDPSKYQARVLRGANAGWFNLDSPGVPVRSVGWHKFQIERSSAVSNACSVSFFVDGVLAATIAGADPENIDCLVLGAIDEGDTKGLVGSALFAHARLEANPNVFDWQALDSSGRDLFPDWMKLREVGTNASALAVMSPYNAAGINIRSPGRSLGSWTSVEEGMVCDNLRGCVEYAFWVPTADAYRLEIEGRERHLKSPAVGLPLLIHLDGELLGRFNLTYGRPSDGLLHCFTPFIQAGQHTLRIHWDDASRGHSLLLKGVRLQSVSSPYVTPTGVKSWVANRLTAQSGVVSAPASSVVSPVCIEGRGQYLSMMSATAGPAYPLSPIPVQPGPGNRWYADVPLSADAPTMIEISYQNGGLKETNQIAWQVTDLLQSTNLAIRKWDSLLLGAAPAGFNNGEVLIDVKAADDSTGEAVVMTTDVITPVPFQFNRAGTFIVSGTCVHAGVSGSIAVQVMEASLDSPAARINRARYWTCTNLPPGTVLDADPRLKLIQLSDEERNQETPALPPRQANEQEYRLVTRSTEPRYILARLGTNGPVLASALVQGFRSWVAPDTYLRLADTYPDGSQLIETAFIIDPFPPGLTIEAKIIVSGVTFDDGTVTKSLAAADFDELGICRLRFIRAAGVKTSVCHTFHVFDKGRLIAWQ